jgi:hypothetical protein
MAAMNKTTGISPRCLKSVFPLFSNECINAMLLSFSWAKIVFLRT